MRSSDELHLNLGVHLQPMSAPYTLYVTLHTIIECDAVAKINMDSANAGLSIAINNLHKKSSQMLLLV